MGTDFIDYFLTEVYSGLEDIAKVIDNEIENIFGSDDESSFDIERIALLTAEDDSYWHLLFISDSEREYELLGSLLGPICYEEKEGEELKKDITYYKKAYNLKTDKVEEYILKTHGDFGNKKIMDNLLWGE